MGGVKMMEKGTQIAQSKGDGARASKEATEERLASVQSEHAVIVAEIEGKSEDIMQIGVALSHVKSTTMWAQMVSSYLMMPSPENLPMLLLIHEMSKKMDDVEESLLAMEKSQAEQQQQEENTWNEIHQLQEFAAKHQKSDTEKLIKSMRESQEMGQKQALAAAFCVLQCCPQ